MEFCLLFFSSQMNIKKYGMTPSFHLSSSAKAYHKETKKRNARVPSIRFVFVSISNAFLFLVYRVHGACILCKKRGETSACEKADKVQGAVRELWRGCGGTFLRGCGEVRLANAADSMRGLLPTKKRADRRVDAKVNL